MTRTLILPPVDSSHEPRVKHELTLWQRLFNAEVLPRQEGWISLAQFNAPTDGTTNARGALASADAKGRTTYVGAGTYYLASSITTASPLHMEYGALFNVGTDAVLTIGGGFSGSLSQHFTSTGTAFTDASISSGSRNLTSNTAVFVSGDVGKWVTVAGAGAAGATLVARITRRTSGTVVVLDVAAGTTVSNATLTFRFGTVIFSGAAAPTLRTKWFGAVWDGSTDDTRPVQLTLSAVPTGGGSVESERGDCLITNTLFPKAGTNWYGQGYISQLKVPSTAWAGSGAFIVGGEYRGMISVDGVDNVSISLMRLYGNLQSGADDCPKMVYSSNADRLNVTHCFIENTGHESIWQGGTITDNRWHKYNDNHFRGCSSAIQLNAVQCEARRNIIEDCDNGILLTGSNLSVTDNTITLPNDDAVAQLGILGGDNVDTGFNLIENNNITFYGNGSSLLQKFGILLSTDTVSASVTTRNYVVAGNTVHMIGTSSADHSYNVCYKVRYHRNVLLQGNFAEIDVRGTGFDITPISGAVSNVMTVTLNNNVVQVNSESGVSYGFRGIVVGSGTLTLVMNGNAVYGMVNGGNSYAYYIDDTTGTVKVYGRGNFTELGAGVRWGLQGYFSGGQGDVTALPFDDSNDLTKQSGYYRSPEVGMLNFQTPAPLTIASDAISLAGLVSTFYAARRTRIVLDTQSAAATDDLATISGGQDGDIVILRITADARNVVVKDGTGNIECGADFTLDTRQDRIVLEYDGVISKWCCLGKWTN